METSALASGSSGNCFFVSSGSTNVLVDAGISAKQIITRLSSIKKNPQEISAILVTHEHSDHIRGVDCFARKFNVPIFATKKTIKSNFLCSNKKLLNEIKNNENFKFKDLEIEAFSKSHKAIDPVSYTISNKKRISIITDLGHVCKNVESQIKDADFLFLESNYDSKMLEQGPYPYFLKNWIKSDIGHLSNNQASLCLLEHASKRLKNVVLSHLSKTNNTPEIAHSFFNSLIKERLDLKLNSEVSQRDMPTKLFKI